MRQIEQALEDNDNVKDEGRMHHFLGISYARLGDFARAFHHQQIALQEHPENFGFHIQYITAAIQQSDLEGAQAALEDALSLWPEKAGLLKLLSDLQTRQGKRIAAYESILKAAEAEPDHPQIRHAVATSILALEKPDLKKAQEHCLMAITLNPDVPLFYRTLSRILSAQHQYSDAIKARLEANEKTPPGMREKVREDESIQLKGILTQLEKAVELID
jgi:tetratricopeptide (TPR) repeat protein